MIIVERSIAGNDETCKCMFVLERETKFKR